MFFLIAVNVVCVFLMALPGLVTRRRGVIPERASRDLSFLLVNFVYPCLVFSSIFSNYSPLELLENWLLPASSFMIMLVGTLVGMTITKIAKFKSDDQRKSFLFQCCMNNYSFLPLPLVLSLFGSKGVAALILSSFGAEIAAWTLGVFILTGGRLVIRNLRHLLSPPLMAIYAAIIARLICEKIGVADAILSANGHYGAARTVLKSLEMFGSATIPLALTIAGCRIADMRPKGLGEPQVWSLSIVRLLVIPVVCVALLHLLPISTLNRDVLTVVAVMPVALASFMFSELYGGDKDFVSSTAIVTHALAMVTVPVMLTVLL